MSGSRFAGELKKTSDCGYVQRAGRSVGKRDRVLFESYCPSIYPKGQTRIAIAMDSGRTGLNLNQKMIYPCMHFLGMLCVVCFLNYIVFFEVVLTYHLKTFGRIKAINGRF